MNRGERKCRSRGAEEKGKGRNLCRTKKENLRKK
jgi:hypothetical protein